MTRTHPNIWINMNRLLSLILLLCLGITPQVQAQTRQIVTLTHDWLFAKGDHSPTLLTLMLM